MLVVKKIKSLVLSLVGFVKEKACLMILEMITSLQDKSVIETVKTDSLNTPLPNA